MDPPTNVMEQIEWDALVAEPGPHPAQEPRDALPQGGQILMPGDYFHRQETLGYRGGLHTRVGARDAVAGGLGVGWVPPYVGTFFVK